MSEVLYQQAKKLDALTELAKDFHEIYDIQQEEINQMREQCLAERVATTAIKAGEKSERLKQVLFKAT